MKKSYISKASRTPYSGDVKITMPYSYGKAVPRGGSLEACLCKDRLTYSRKCCEGFLINQGIGSITGTGERLIESPWASAFSSGFGPTYQ